MDVFQLSLVPSGGNFVRKAILAFNYSITSTFDSTSTDRPALKVKVALPLFKVLHGNASKTPGHWLPPTQWSEFVIFCLVCLLMRIEEVEQP